jgi:hypothetical protein
LPFDLACGCLQHFIRAGVNDIDDRFGLGKIDSSVKKGPFGKLTGFGNSSAVPQHQFKNRIYSNLTAVGVYLNDILFGVRPGRSHNTEQHLIHYLSILRIDDVAQI